MTDHQVVIVGSGVAGTTAAIFTARASLDTLIVNHGESILERNAHLENVPGFPAGVNSRTFLELTHEQAGRNGCSFADGRVTRISETDGGFALRVESAAGEQTVDAEFVVCASWSDPSYLDGLDIGLVARGSKTYVDVDEFGRTGVDGLYAAGRIAEKPHQTVVAAGHGAEVAVTLLEDDDGPFYHDWSAPDLYFTGRGRDLPPGCEEIDETERRKREEESLAVMREYFAEPRTDEPEQHPSVEESN